MTPLEVMAKARWEAQAHRLFYFKVTDINGAWEKLGRDTQLAVMEDMRTALLALAECVWPKEARQEAAAAVTNDSMLYDLAGRVAEKSARALLRSIASAPTPD